MRRATLRRNCSAAQSAISIHALREEGDHKQIAAEMETEYISIHAFRGEGDEIVRHRMASFCQISIHALREEGDHIAGVSLMP